MSHEQYKPILEILIVAGHLPLDELHRRYIIFIYNNVRETALRNEFDMDIVNTRKRLDEFYAVLKTIPIASEAKTVSIVYLLNNRGINMNADEVDELASHFEHK